jgi:hypothetical protein
MILYVVLSLYNLTCTIEYVITHELWQPESVEQFAVLNGTDSPSIVESSSSVKKGSHVLLSSTGGEGSTSNAPNTGSTSNAPNTGSTSNAPNTGYGYPEQDIEDKVETFESLKETSPSGEELRSQCNDDPERIFETSKDLLREVYTDRNALLSDIESEEDKGNITQFESLDLQSRVYAAADTHRIEIKETNNTAVEYIDDSSATEHCLFKNPTEPFDTDGEYSDTEEDDSDTKEDDSNTKEDDSDTKEDDSNTKEDDSDTEEDDSDTEE